MQICKLANDIIATNDKYGAAQSWAGRPFQAWVSSCCGIQTAPHQIELGSLPLLGCACG